MRSLTSRHYPQINGSIDVIEEKTNLEQNVQLNIWDFGGQEIQASNTPVLSESA